jgi:tripartite-type tricarboxylate transporter receptor subunit TctC
MRRAALAAAFAAACGAQAQTDYPSRPIHFIIPFAAGGGSDVAARVIAEPLSQRLGQPVVIENKPGANATIGADLVAKSAPDGYTMLYASPGPQVTNPYLMAKLPYDPVKDLLPVARIGVFTAVLAVNPNVPARTVKELVDYAKANPGKINCSSSGVASGSHLACEYFKSVAGVEIMHIPYKGTGAAIADLVGGTVQMAIDSMAALLPYIKSGQLRAVAIAQLERSPVLPDVPTLAETYPGFDGSPMNYLVVRGGTPPAIVERLNKELNAVLAMPAVKQKLLDMGVATSPSTPEEMVQQVNSEREKWRKVIEAAGVKAE